jgi:formylglycine-generating enzyme required for sulfatase activity
LSRVFVVHDARGERQLDEQALPLCLGGAAAGDIVMPGVPAAQRVAYIAMADGHAFVQTADDNLQVFHNHERLDGSRWLKSGDEVQLGEGVVSWTVRGDVVSIATRTQSLAGPATPAKITPPSSPPKRVLPLVAPPAPQSVRRSGGRLRWGLFAAFVLLLLASLFVLLATPIAVQVAPEPDRQAIHGFPPTVKLGGRRLALPGRYTVEAHREGFQSLQTAIDVRRGGLQSFSFELQELPGRVRLLLEPAVDYRVFVDGEPVTTNAQGFTDMPAGSHQLRIETGRYLPVSAQVEIAGRGQAQEFAYRLEPGWAEVRIGSEPQGAEVRIDGEPLGVTPLTAELLAGMHSIELSLENYKTARLQQAIVAGGEVSLESIVLEPADGQLSVNSDPTAATISIEGVFYGTTPATLSLASGESHRVRLTKPGYQPVDTTLQLGPSETRQIDVTLPAEYGIVFLSTDPADASLMIDGKPSGEATRRLRLTARPHTLAFSKPGYVSQQVTVTPRAGVSKNIDITLKTPHQAAADTRAASMSRRRSTPAGQRLQLIRPTGSFRMGASRREAGRRANESPRLVQLSRPFYLSEKEVTNAEYRRFQPAHNSGQAEGVSLDADTQPVVNVSWDDAARYCNWLSRQDGLTPAYREDNGRLRLVRPVSNGYRLPTEAEWAYVARQLDRQAMARYPWTGPYPPTQVVGNFADASIADTLADTVPNYNDGYRVSAPVGSFPVQPGGFYDLGGNVAEWSNDYYAVYPAMAETLVNDPAGPERGDHHVVRDSSWRQGGIAELRLSYRDYSREPRPDLGFRIARYAQQDQ